MRLSEFAIGGEFCCGGKRWRCTDIGTRVVVAISLEPHEIVELEVDPTDASKRVARHYITSDESWHNGPPYAVVETVFDEYDQGGCCLDPADDSAFGQSL